LSDLLLARARFLSVAAIKHGHGAVDVRV